jgi:hypothetical protein
LVDAGDSKSPEVHASCRFDSDLRHHLFYLLLDKYDSVGAAAFYRVDLDEIHAF